MDRRSSQLWNVALAAGVVLTYLTTFDFLAVAAVVVLWLAWRFLRPDEGPPILAMAFSFQWMQVTCGLFYTAWTGRQLPATAVPELGTMIMISLATLLAILAGLRMGEYLVQRLGPAGGLRPTYAFTWQALIAAYGLSVAVVATVQQIAWDYPSLTQGILALTHLRLALLYLILRRLVMPQFRVAPFIAIVAFEVGLGFTGFFAGFREPLVMAVIALLEGFDVRKRVHWVAIAAMLVAAVAAALFWIGVRRGYREAIWDNDAATEVAVGRFDRLRQLASGWEGRDASQTGDDVEKLVDRLWTVYYPALAVQRVPKVLPHTDGRLMLEALSHVFTPRILYPDKATMSSESELVRRYSGVMVASERQNTNIAFGYAAESYVDFGVPIMFIPMFCYGVLVGAIYRGLLRYIRFRELAIGTATVVCWLSLYLFERSWAKTLGLTLTLTVYLGFTVVLFDRMWLERDRRRYELEETSDTPSLEAVAHQS